MDIEKKVLKHIAERAYKTAEKVANSECIFYAYQKKIPNKIKELRKF